MLSPKITIVYLYCTYIIEKLCVPHIVGFFYLLLQIILPTLITLQLNNETKKKNV